MLSRGAEADQGVEEMNYPKRGQRAETNKKRKKKTNPREYARAIRKKAYSTGGGGASVGGAGA